MSTDASLLIFLLLGLGGAAIFKTVGELSFIEQVLYGGLTISSLFLVLLWVWGRFSKAGKDKRKRLENIGELPSQLLLPSETSVLMGVDEALKVPIYLPDIFRSRHVHILGSTGSGKTESVILNFLRQDVSRGLGSIILDAKGDVSFLKALQEWVPEERLKVFDLSNPESLSYDPLLAGTSFEAAQRLFSSLTWSEEYYKSKAFSALQKLFRSHVERTETNPTFKDLSFYLDNPENYAAVTQNESYPAKLALKDFEDLSGLRDQVKTLCLGYLETILSPKQSDIHLEDAHNGTVIYFRLQSLLSPQLVTTLGRLLINHLNFLAGTAHRGLGGTAGDARLVPTYLDEFASFACPEFADLISKARSAGFALHFSHQSVGDLSEVSPGFINRITDNSATKIILRINDPDSAEFFARSFGTKIYQKFTQRVTNSKETDSAEVIGEGSVRDAHQFRSHPDLFKTLPTGVGSVLVAHGINTPHGASSVFKIQFPKLKKEEKQLVSS